MLMVRFDLLAMISGRSVWRMVSNGWMSRNHDVSFVVMASTTSSPSAVCAPERSFTASSRMSEIPYARSTGRSRASNR